MEKPEYIKNIENKTGDFLSKISLGELNIKSDTFDKKNFVLLYIDMIFKEGESIWKEKVIKTSHGFYIYLIRPKDNLNPNIVEIDIYHNPEQVDEITLFVRQLIKQIKN